MENKTVLEEFVEYLSNNVPSVYPPKADKVLNEFYKKERDQICNAYNYGKDTANEYDSPKDGLAYFTNTFKINYYE